MSVPQDPLTAIVAALRNLFLPMADLGLVDVRLGWPDAQYAATDANLPTLFVWPLSDTGENRNGEVYAVIPQTDRLSGTVYREKLRKAYSLQLCLVAKTLEDATRIAWGIEQQLVLTPRVQTGETEAENALFRYKGQTYPTDTAGYFQRNLNFDVTARVLEASQAYLLQQVQPHETT